MSRRNELLKLTPELLLRAYSAGVFPMAESREDEEVLWIDPVLRGILPLDRFRVPRKLRKTVRQNRFRVSCNTAFEQVIDLCAESTPDREDTWINAKIRAAVIELHAQGYAHSIECWDQGNLVGGLYGLSLGGAFFGESMFSRATDASKVALVHLVTRLRMGGFTLLDTQFITDHLKQFGAIEIPARDYHALLKKALDIKPMLHIDPEPLDYRRQLEALFKTVKR